MKKRTRIFAVLLSCTIFILGTGSAGADNLQIQEEMGMTDELTFEIDETPISQKWIDDLTLEEYLEKNPNAAYVSNINEQSLASYLTTHSESDYVIHDVSLEQHIAGDGLLSVAAANGWVQDSTGWRYFENGVAVTGWKWVSTAWYYMDPTTTYMVTGWRKIDGEWYYFDTNGAMARGAVTIGTSDYYFADTGEMYQGLYPSASAPICYYGHPDNADAGAKFKAGWLHLGNNWYYANTSTGTLYSGLRSINNKKFYFDATSRKMKTGNVVVNGSTYYFDEDSSSSNYGVLWEAMYDVVTDDLGTTNNEIVNDNTQYLSDIGYYTSLYEFRTPVEFYNSLPNKKISIVHGHGSSNGYIIFDNGKGNHASDGSLYASESSLTNQSAQIAAYSSGALSYVDLVIYTSCYSGLGGKSSIAGRTHAKGAANTLGYQQTVAKGEWFSLYFLWEIKQNADWTYSECLAEAVSYFDQMHPEMIRNSARPSNTTNNLITFGF